MFRKRSDREVALAAHSGWIAELRDTSRASEQRLRMIELRVAALESQLAGRTRGRWEAR